MMVKPHDPEWTEEHQKASEPVDYQPDWDNIPAKLKYCYVENGEDGVFSVIYRCEKFPVLPPPSMTEYIRPLELVDGAWYAVTDGHGSQRIGMYCGSANKMNLGGSYWNNTSELTIHQRIPDSMWESEDER